MRRDRMALDPEGSILDAYNGDIERVPSVFKVCWRGWAEEVFNPRCTRAVDPDDPVGLCDQCKEDLREGSGS